MGRNNNNVSQGRGHSNLFYFRHVFGGLYFALCSWGTYGVWSEWNEDDPKWVLRMILGILGMAITFGPDIKRYGKELLCDFLLSDSIDPNTGMKDNWYKWYTVIILLFIPISAIYQRFFVERGLSDMFVSHSLLYYLWDMISTFGTLLFMVCAVFGIPAGVIYSIFALCFWNSELNYRHRIKS